MNLKRFIKENWAWLLTIGCLYLFLLLSYYLYRLPMAAIAYPVALSLVAFIIVCIVKYRREARHHQKLMELLSRLGEATSVLEELPVPANTFEEDYLEIFKALENDRQRFISNVDVRQVDLLDYYSVWAHQIKTPIASMSLHLQGEDTPLARQLKRDLFRIEQYVDMVLTYLRLDGDGSDYVFKECELDTIIKDAVRKFSGEFIGRKLALNYQPVHMTILTDEKWLGFVVEQVLSNALKYTREGSISIGVEEREGQNYLAVADTGIGIAPEDLPRIFDKGYTGYNGRSDKKATGIGLYLCRKICDRLGHDLKAESVVDQGTKVLIGLARENRRHE